MKRERREFPEQIRTILSGRPKSGTEDPILVCAAVLIPLLYKEGEWHVLVTQRTQMVEHHKGQISFPGGTCEPGDANRLETALRETYEEIGVPRERIDVLGALDDFETISHFVVTPYVGVIPHPVDYVLNTSEVESVVEVPLSFLCDPAHLRVERREHEGRVYDLLFWDYPVADATYTIWGVTAHMLKSFLDLL